MVTTKFQWILGKRTLGVTLYPLIILKKGLETNKVVVSHEKIHLRQQLELLLLPFYLWYFIEYLIRLIQYKNGFEAYKNISFEREAYANEDNLNYFKERKLYSFFKYI